MDRKAVLDTEEGKRAITLRIKPLNKRLWHHRFRILRKKC